jgi:hypothetical protein
MIIKEKGFFWVSNQGTSFKGKIQIKKKLALQEFEPRIAEP